MPSTRSISAGYSEGVWQQRRLHWRSDATVLQAVRAGGLDGFVNIGFAGARTNVVDGSLNIGLTYTGLFDERPNDRLGIAAGVIRASNAYKDMQIAAGEGVKSYEANFELTWRAPITSWLTVQPDIQ